MVLMFTALAMLISGPRLSKKPGQSAYVKMSSDATSGTKVMDWFVCPIFVISLTSLSSATAHT